MTVEQIEAMSGLSADGWNVHEWGEWQMLLGWNLRIAAVLYMAAMRGPVM